MQIKITSLAVLTVTALLAMACSVANPFAPTNASAKTDAEQQRLKWAQCMRQHGVNVPDPGPNGRIAIQATGDPGGGGSDGPDPGSEQQLQAAMDACKQYAPSGGKADPKQSQQMYDQAVKFSQCMRDHGITNFPDPQQSGNGIRISASPGAFDPTSDQFQQAQKACEQYMPKPQGGGAGPVTSGSR